MDYDFTGGWSREVGDDADNFMSRNGMIIMYAKCPFNWRNSMQTEIALSTAEAEYIALYYALREVLQLLTTME